MKSCAFILFIVLASLLSCRNTGSGTEPELIRFEKQRVLSRAALFLDEKPVTISASSCERSAGSRHDFYSEGDYWWPDSLNPDGPYIRRDGLSNPENFPDHRKALMRFSMITGALTSAWLLDGDTVYANKAMEHLEAWFINDSTRMNPNMLYAQAIKGRYTGRGIGIIDALPLVEVSRSVVLLEQTAFVSPEKIKEIKDWFTDFLNWLNEHEYGKAEMIHPNNHGSCFALQAAAYAGLTGNDSVLKACAARFREDFLPRQMGPDGSFPLELERTKPYSYSLFNLDALCTLAQVIRLYSGEDLWNYSTPEGRSLGMGLDFMYPYIADKESWPYPEDVMYGNKWPVSQPALFLAALAFENMNYLNTWISLEHDPVEYEIQRNLVIRYPMLWIDKYVNPN